MGATSQGLGESATYGALNAQGTAPHQTAGRNEKKKVGKIKQGKSNTERRGSQHFAPLRRHSPRYAAKSIGSSSICVW